MHRAVFPHQGLDAVGALRPLLSRSMPNGGDWSTVNVGPVAADALYEQGATDVLVVATHAVFSSPAVDRMKNSRISEVIVTNSLPIPEEKQFDKLTVLSIAPLIARAITAVFSDGSVTSLFEGDS